MDQNKQQEKLAKHAALNRVMETLRQNAVCDWDDRLLYRINRVCLVDVFGPINERPAGPSRPRPAS
jgi:hypothetical protein